METRNEKTALLLDTIDGYRARNKILEKEKTTRDNFQFGKLVGLVSGMLLSCAVLPLFAMLPFMGNFLPILIAAAMPGLLSLGFAVFVSMYWTKRDSLIVECNACEVPDLKAQLMTKADKAERAMQFYDGARAGAFYGALFCLMVAAVVPLFLPSAGVVMPVAMELGSMIAAGLLNLVIHTLRNAVTNRKISANNERIAEIQADNLARCGTTQQLTLTLAENPAPTALIPPSVTASAHAENPAPPASEPIAVATISPTEAISDFQMGRPSLRS